MNPTDLSNLDSDFLDRYPIILPSFMTPEKNDEDNDINNDNDKPRQMDARKKFMATRVETPLEKLLSRLPGVAESSSNKNHFECNNNNNNAYTNNNNNNTTTFDLGSLWQDFIDAPEQEMECSRTNPTRSMSSMEDDSMVSRSSSASSFAAMATEGGPNAPNPYDVLCVRGRGHFKHPGNMRFRELVKQFVPRYMLAHKRMERSSVIEALIHIVQQQPPPGQPPARLLKWSRTSGQWEPLDMNQARDKVGHALRDAVQETQGFRLPKPS